MTLSSLFKWETILYLNQPYNNFIYLLISLSMLDKYWMIKRNYSLLCFLLWPNNFALLFNDGGSPQINILIILYFVGQNSKGFLECQNIVPFHTITFPNKIIFINTLPTLKLFRIKFWLWMSTILIPFMGMFHFPIIFNNHKPLNDINKHLCMFLFHL